MIKEKRKANVHYDMGGPDKDAGNNLVNLINEIYGDELYAVPFHVFQDMGHHP